MKFLILTESNVEKQIVINPTKICVMKRVGEHTELRFDNSIEWVTESPTQIVEAMTGRSGVGIPQITVSNDEFEGLEPIVRERNV